MSATVKALLRAVPSIDELLRAEPLQAALLECGHELVTSVLRDTVEHARARLREEGERAGEACSQTALLASATRRLAALLTPSLKRVFNLTGTVLHTNLGRAPLPAEAIAAMTAVASGASNLEYDLSSGRRGDRDVHVEQWICRLTGAEAATVVNNNAAAVFLTLNTLARHKEVLVSRGELVEIGGAFRIPDVMARAGARLVEVGTTNRTHAPDFSNAVTARSALIMKVHTSNYMIAGFTSAVAEIELAALAHAANLALVVDLGSGTLIDLAQFGLPREPTVASSIAAGADLVTFSGDKLLGGPQAGIIAGRADLVRMCQQHALARALRPGAHVLLSLQQLALAYLDRTVVDSLPFWQMATTSINDLTVRAHEIVAVAGVGEVVATEATPGAGSAPNAGIASVGVRVRGDHLAALRNARPPIVARSRDGATVLDLRTVNPSDDHYLVEALRACVS